MPRKDAPPPGPISAQAQQSLVSEGIDKYELPKSIVTRIAKSAIPENTKLQKETVLSLVKGSTVFINYLAATAHEVAESKQRKTIVAADVIKALEMIEFGDMTDTLNSELAIYREVIKARKDGGAAPSTAASTVASSSKAKVKSKSKDPAPETTLNGAGSLTKGRKTVPPQYLQRDVLDSDSDIPDVDADDALIPRPEDDDDDDDPMDGGARSAATALAATLSASMAMPQ